MYLTFQQNGLATSVVGLVIDVHENDCTKLTVPQLYGILLVGKRECRFWYWERPEGWYESSKVTVQTALRFSISRRFIKSLGDDRFILDAVPGWYWYPKLGTLSLQPYTRALLKLVKGDGFYLSTCMKGYMSHICTRLQLLLEFPCRSSSARRNSGSDLSSLGLANTFESKSTPGFKRQCALT